MEIWKHRKPLGRLKQALAGGRVTLGFIGGSITDARPRHNWPEPVIAWFTERYPSLAVYVENAAIGATGSECAVFRAERDLIDRGCDIVFVDYAVNDQDEPSEKRMRSREGLLRKLLADGRRDVVPVYTYSQGMYESMVIQQTVPDTIREFEELAEHYGLGSVWMGLYALQETAVGRMRWEEWLPDGLHPTARGSLSYAESVIRFLERELELEEGNGPVNGEPAYVQGLPDAYNPNHWEKAYALSFGQVERYGPWTIRRWPHLEWIDQVLGTSAIGSRLAFSFIGTGLVLGFDFGKTSAEYRYRVDGAEWVTVSRPRPDWCGDHGWYHTSAVAEDLERREHRVELEIIHGNRTECKGTNFHLALIGIIP